MKNLVLIFVLIALRQVAGQKETLYVETFCEDVAQKKISLDGNVKVLFETLVSSKEKHLNELDSIEKEIHRKTVFYLNEIQTYENNKNELKLIFERSKDSLKTKKSNLEKSNNSLENQIRLTNQIIDQIENVFLNKNISASNFSIRKSIQNRSFYDLRKCSDKKFVKFIKDLSKNIVGLSVNLTLILDKKLYIIRYDQGNHINDLTEVQLDEKQEKKFSKLFCNSSIMGTVDRERLINKLTGIDQSILNLNDSLNNQIELKSNLIKTQNSNGLLDLQIRSNLHKITDSFHYKSKQITNNIKDLKSKISNVKLSSQKEINNCNEIIKNINNDIEKLAIKFYELTIQKTIQKINTVNKLIKNNQADLNTIAEKKRNEAIKQINLEASIEFEKYLKLNKIELIKNNRERLDASKLNTTEQYYESTSFLKSKKYLDNDLNLLMIELYHPLLQNKVISQICYDPVTGKKHGPFFNGNNKGYYVNNLLSSKKYVFYTGSGGRSETIKKYTIEEVKSGIINGNVNVKSYKPFSNVLGDNETFSYYYHKLNNSNTSNEYKIIGELMVEIRNGPTWKNKNNTFTWRKSNECYDILFRTGYFYIIEDIFKKNFKNFKPLFYNRYSLNFLNGLINGEIKFTDKINLYYSNGILTGFSRKDPNNLKSNIDSVSFNDQIWKINNNLLKRKKGLVIGGIPSINSFLSGDIYNDEFRVEVSMESVYEDTYHKYYYNSPKFLNASLFKNHLIYIVFNRLDISEEGFFHPAGVSEYNNGAVGNFISIQEKNNLSINEKITPINFLNSSYFKENERFISRLCEPLFSDTTEHVIDVLVPNIKQDNYFSVREILECEKGVLLMSEEKINVKISELEDELILLENQVELLQEKCPTCIKKEGPISTPQKEGPIFEFPDVEAKFVGGPLAMAKWLHENLIYPENASKMRDQGKVFLSFVVEKDGSITNLKVERGISKDLDQEAKRVVSKMPNWIPGESKGRAVRARCRIPINFQLK